MKIGEIIPADREITLNEGKNTVKILVANKGDRPVQVGSHYHFFEVNAFRLTVRQLMDIIWTFRQEHQFVLNRAKKKRFSSHRWAAESVYLD